VSAAREVVLGRIRRANSLAGSPPGAPDSPPQYRVRGDQDQAARLELFCERLTDYRATVHRVPAAGLAAAVPEILARRGVSRIVVPPGLDLAALGLDSAGLTGIPGLQVVADEGEAGLSPAGLDACDGAVTAAAVAIAETGTIVLDASPDQGRRAITLVPDYHLCVVAAGQVVELVPEAVARLAPVAGRPLTWISGPSATSDIELERVEGVHGPRTLEVILTDD
jgi:L-lactate dehydrogenase complex protein LldG